MNHLIIEGFIGSGKGAAARAAAKKLGLSVIDIDKMISERLKMTVGEIYDRYGEKFYRAMETVMLDELLEQKEQSVIVLGSGVAMMPQNAPYLKKLGHVYYIHMKQDDVVRNMRNSEKHKWIHDDGWEEQVARLYKEREPAYKKTADCIIEGKGLSAAAIADRIVEEEQKSRS
ncbi:MAG: shikimate kinase [Eubacteriales bacterium]|nr:shikimate kinase [Eubacteriales bacterium]